MAEDDEETVPAAEEEKAEEGFGEKLDEGDEDEEPSTREFGGDRPVKAKVVSMDETRERIARWSTILKRSAKKV